MKKVLAVLIAVATGLAAQEAAPKQEAPKETQAIVDVKHANVERVAKVVMGLGGSVSYDSALRVITVRGPADTVAATITAVKHLDQPEPPASNIELMVHLLIGSAKDATDSVPPDLQPTVKQLKSLFPYKGYRVMDSLYLRGREGQFTTSAGGLPGTDSTYSFRALPTISPGTAPRLIRLSQLKLTLNMTGQIGGQRFSSNSDITTDLDAREGQKTVVGKSNIAGSEDALILVVTPRILE
jgi:hypothetical protein